MASILNETTENPIIKCHVIFHFIINLDWSDAMFIDEKENINQLNNYLMSKYNLPKISFEELLTCFSSAKKSSDLKRHTNRAYAVIGDKFLDAILFDYKFESSEYLSEEELDKLRQKFTDNKNHKDIMIRSGLAKFVMNGQGESVLQATTVSRTLSAVYESLIYVIYKEFGKTILLNFIKQIYTI